MRHTFESGGGMAEARGARGRRPPAGSAASFVGADVEWYDFLLYGPNTKVKGCGSMYC